MVAAPAVVRPPPPVRVEGSQGLRVCLVTRDEPGTTGTSRYAGRLGQDLRPLGIDPLYLSTRPAGRAARALALGRRARMDLNTFLAHYPLRLQWPAADVYHLTVQTYAGLLLLDPPPGPVVVTVHDIIPYLTRHDRRLRAYGHGVHRVFDWLAMRGLRRAQSLGPLLADSVWTKRTLVDALGLRPEGIAVVPLGVDQEAFRPAPVPPEVYLRYGLSEGAPYVLYVGSEDPRKNLDVLLRAFALVSPRLPQARMLKVGPAQHQGQRRRLETLAGELGIGPAVRFLDHVSESDLPRLYNAAAVCVLPSAYEGFGLPVLEAMACGTPVVCAAAGALPELVGGAAPLFPAHSAEALAGVLLQLLRDPARRAELARRGRGRAASFTWQQTAAATAEHYRAAAPRRSAS